MEYEIKVWCDNCGSTISEKDEAYCGDCQKSQREEIEELKRRIEDLEKDY